MQGASKVGGLVIVFVLMLYGAYAILGESLFAEKTKVYYADFPDAGGVTEGTKVLMAGVKVGNIVKITLLSPMRARMTLKLKSDISIPEGSRAVLPQSLIGLGDTPVSIFPPERPAGELAPGSVIPGSRPGPLDAMLPDSKETVKELNATLRATRKLLEDTKLTGGIEKLMATSNDTIARFGALASQTQGLLAANRKQINMAIHSATMAMADVQQSTAMIAKLVKEGKLQDKSVALLDALNKTTEKTQNLVTDIDKFVNDPSLRQPLSTTMSNVSDITGTGKKIAVNTEEITANTAVVSKKAIELADKASLIEDEARDLMKKVGGFFSKPGSKVPPVHLSMDILRESKPQHWRTDLNADVTLFETPMTFGIYDAFESNKINAQMYKQVTPSLDYRYGIYASKPALGVDFRLTPQLGIRGDLFDVNDPRLNLRAQYDLRSGVYGWIGMDRILGRNAPTVGFGVRK